MVQAHADEDDRVELFEYPKLGKGGVIAETFRRADADLVGFVDADGATPPQELLRLAEASLIADGAIATRRHPAAVLPARRPFARRLTSAGFALAVRRLLGLPYRDTQCGAKVLRREVVEDVLPRLRARDLLFDVDLLAAATEAGHRIVEVPTIWIDQAGLARQRRRRQRPHGRIAGAPVGAAPDEGGRRCRLLTSRSSARIPPAASATAASAASPATPRSLADALGDRGADVTVIAPTEDGAPARERHGDRDRRAPLRAGRRRAAARRRGRARDRRPDRPPPARDLPLRRPRVGARPAGRAAHAAPRAAVRRW